jgi:hypothetical protein
LPNNQFGQVYYGGSTDINSYDYLNIGGGQLTELYNPLPFKVRSGATVTLKCGKNIQGGIHILPCTTIDSGSNFHAYIEIMDCSNSILPSYKNMNYSDDYCNNLPPPPKVNTSDCSNSTNITSNLGLINFSISPNPVHDILYIKTNNIFSGQIIQIYSPVGVKVFETEFSKQIDVSNLNQGVYYIRIGNLIDKFVKIL